MVFRPHLSRFQGRQPPSVPEFDSAPHSLSVHNSCVVLDTCMWMSTGVESDQSCD